MISLHMASMRAWNSSRGIMAPTSMATKAWPWFEGSSVSATQLWTPLIIAAPLRVAVSSSTSTASP